MRRAGEACLSEGGRHSIDVACFLVRTGPAPWQASPRAQLAMHNGLLSEQATRWGATALHTGEAHGPPRPEHASLPSVPQHAPSYGDLSLEPNSVAHSRAKSISYTGFGAGLGQGGWKEQDEDGGSSRCGRRALEMLEVRRELNE